MIFDNPLEPLGFESLVTLVKGGEGDLKSLWKLIETTPVQK